MNPVADVLKVFQLNAKLLIFSNYLNLKDVKQLMNKNVQHSIWLNRCTPEQQGKCEFLKVERLDGSIISSK